MIEEVALRQNELADAPLDSIYFGGGTPSLLQPEEIAQLIDAAAKVFRFSPRLKSL